MSRGNDAVPSWSGFNYQGIVLQNSHTVISNMCHLIYLPLLNFLLQILLEVL